MTVASFTWHNHQHITLWWADCSAAMNTNTQHYCICSGCKTEHGVVHAYRMISSMSTEHITLQTPAQDALVTAIRMPNLSYALQATCKQRNVVTLRGLWNCNKAAYNTSADMMLGSEENCCIVSERYLTAACLPRNHRPCFC
jgi:hypothetical protein